MKKKYFFILTCEITGFHMSNDVWKQTESGEFIPADHKVPEKDQFAIYTFLFGRFKEGFRPGLRLTTVFYYLTEIPE